MPLYPFIILVTHPQNLRFSLEDPARTPSRNFLMLRYPIDLHLPPRSSFGPSQPHGRFRIVLPPARRQAHTSCGRQGRRDASPRGSAEFSASRHSLEQRRGAAAEEFLKSRVSSIPYRNNSVVSSRRLKHLLLPRAVPRNVPRPATFWRAPRSGR